MTFQIRRMTASDIPAAMTLKEAAGWNQVPEDWLGYLKLEPSGCFVGLVSDEVVASGTALSYDSQFGWIGMILVSPEFRRRGYATRIMETSLDYLESKACLTQRLDATEAGAQVYQKFGFTQEAIVERWVRPARAALSGLEGDIQSSSITDRQIAEVCSWDAEAFGASREKLLSWYVKNEVPSLLASGRRKPLGYVMGRAGSGAYQIGPLVAEDDTVASRLAVDFLSGIPSKPVIADVSRDNPAAIELLERLGFSPSRRLIRMYRGKPPPPGRKERIYFLAGFEFG